MPGIANPSTLEVAERLETDRLILRAHQLTDLPAMHAAVEASHTELNEWMPWARNEGPQSIAETEGYIRRTMADFILRQMFGYSMLLKADARYVGNIGVHPKKWHVPSFEIGYWLNSADAGQGYMSEAAQCLTDYFIQTIGARRMVIRCNSRNRASAKVALKCGYTLEGVSRNNTRDNRGELVDMESYSIAITDE